MFNVPFRGCFFQVSPLYPAPERVLEANVGSYIEKDQITRDDQKKLTAIEQTDALRSLTEDEKLVRAVCLVGGSIWNAASCIYLHVMGQ